MKEVNDILAEVKNIKRKYLYTALKVNNVKEYSFEYSKPLAKVLNDDGVFIGTLELHTYRNDKNPISMKLGKIIFKTKEGANLTLASRYKR